MLETSILATRMRAAGFDTYSEKNYSDAKRNAQRNLDGRTHYVDDDTLRYFGSRILSSSDHADGLIFCIIESSFLDYAKTRRGFRFVAFDIFGTVLERADLDHTFSSKETARKAFYKWLDSFATIGHYREILESKACKMEETAQNLRAISADCGE